MNRKKLILLAILAIFILASIGNAQDKDDEAKVTGSFAKAVKNAAFSADAISETVQILADGNTLTRQATGRLFRDNNGGFRQEEMSNPVGIFGAYVELKPVILILDPVANLQFILDPETKTARRSPLEPPIMPTSENSETQTSSAVEKADFISKTESLGIRKIEGVESVGTRTVTKIPAGKVGNARAIEVVYERWYSNDLQVIIFSKHNDPRFGEQTYRLTNISRREPERSLFRLPADYKIIINKLRPSRAPKPPEPRKPKPPIPLPDT